MLFEGKLNYRCTADKDFSFPWRWDSLTDSPPMSMSQQLERRTIHSYKLDFEENLKYNERPFVLCGW